MNASTDSPLTREEIIRLRTSTPTADLARDEAFWARVARLYDRAENFVQLDYGYYHPAMRAVLEVECASAREVNRRGSHFKRLESTTLLEAARADLARISGVSAEEIALTHNASEAMNIIINGLPLRAGDEVVCSDQDYPGMDEAWTQRARRDGLLVRRVPLPLHPGSDEAIVACFEAAITPRTRVLHVTHLVHYTGQVLPVRALCALGRRHGLEVVVDAAHAFAQLEFSIQKLDCDYLATSLHKWLGAPLGLGLLHVRRTRIAALQPLFGDVLRPADDIRRLEHFGNRPDSLHAGLREAIRWHEALSTPLKQARLTHLQQTWTDAARALPALRMLTPADPSRHAGLGAFAVAGEDPVAIAEWLLREHRLFVAPREHPVARGVRVTPGLPTSRAEIAHLVQMLQKRWPR